jgi:hypothetical protein
MIAKKRKQLGSRLPAVKEIGTPDAELLDRVNAGFDSLVPEWAGLLDPKAPGATPAPKFYRDEITGVVTRARDGLVITDAIRREVMDLYTQRVRK